MSRPRKSWRDLQISTRSLSELLQFGCSDGNCRIRFRPVGMHTNGGCKCVARLGELALEVAECAEDNKRTTGAGTVMP